MALRAYILKYKGMPPEDYDIKTFNSHTNSMSICSTRIIELHQD